MKNQIIDERVVATRQRWAARGFYILYFALNIDIIVRFLVLKQSPQQWLDIGLIWMATTFYVSFGMVGSGVNLAPKTMPKTNIMMMTIIGLEIPALFWLMGMVHSWTQFVLYAALAGGSAFAMQVFQRRIFSRWERKSLGQGTEEK